MDEATAEIIAEKRDSAVCKCWLLIVVDADSQLHFKRYRDISGSWLFSFSLVMYCIALAPQRLMLASSTCHPRIPETVEQ